MCDSRSPPPEEGRGEGVSVSTLLDQATRTLAAAGLDHPRREARLLVGHAAGLDAAGLFARAHEHVAAPGLAALVARRAAREPLALITGHQPFWTLDLLVSSDTLIPRADTETLIEAALDAFPHRDAGCILDLGTGTGCLLLASLVEFPAAFGVGIDRNPGATALARANAARNGLAGRAAFVCGDWSAAVSGRFDLILSNPPYIERDVISTLMPEVSRHEPALALDGGPDGLDAYRAIAAALPTLLSPSGIAILELGAGQARAVAGLAVASGLVPMAPRSDLAGIPRALPIRLGKRGVGETGGGE